MCFSNSFEKLPHKPLIDIHCILLCVSELSHSHCEQVCRVLWRQQWHKLNRTHTHTHTHQLWDVSELSDCQLLVTLLYYSVELSSSWVTWQINTQEPDDKGTIVQLQQYWYFEWTNTLSLVYFCSTVTSLIIMWQGRWWCFSGLFCFSIVSRRDFSKKHIL